MKFGRNWKLVYIVPLVKEDGTLDKDNAERVTIGYPLKIELNIERAVFSQTNRASFSVYNLGLSTRNKIFQDKYNINRWCFVEFYAGYGDNMPLLFKGKVWTAYSEKVGVDVVTSIEAMDTDVIQSYSNVTFEVGTERKEVLQRLVADMPNITLGSVGKLGEPLDSRLVVSDKTFLAIDNLTGGHAFVDGDKLHVLNNNEVLGDVSVYKITSETGLLGTPRRQEAQLEIDCVFTPEITVGQMIEIESTTAPAQFNGQYKVIGIHHTGVISGAECGTLTTTLNLFVGALLPNSNFLFTKVFDEPNSEVVGDTIKILTDKEAQTIQEVYRYLLKNGKPPETKITRSIYWKQVLLNYNKQGVTPSIAVLSNLYLVASSLQKFLDIYYPSAKIVITSGWRSSSYNASIKGAAPNSLHIQGKAIDFYINPLYQVYQYFSQYWSAGYKYMGNGFIHCDIGSTSVRGIANDR